MAGPRNMSATIAVHPLVPVQWVRLLASYPPTCSLKSCQQTFCNYLLWSELLGSWEILSIIVAKMIVAHNWRRLDARAHEEVDKDRLYLCLSRLEVVAANEHVMLLGQLDHSRNKRVLWTSVDVCYTLEDWRNSKQCWRWNLGLTATDRLHQSPCRVVQSRTHFAETLCVSGPQYYHLNNNITIMLLFS